MVGAAGITASKHEASIVLLACDALEAAEHEPAVAVVMLIDAALSKGRVSAPPGRRRGRAGIPVSERRLYSATIAFAADGIMLQAFHASVARDPAEVVDRLRTRFGEEMLSGADIRIGFHPEMPLAIALVPEGVANIIRRVERDCGAPAARSFAVDIEQRIEV